MFIKSIFLPAVLLPLTLLSQAKTDFRVLVQTSKNVFPAVISERLHTKPAQVETVDEYFGLYLIHCADSASRVNTLKRASASGICIHWQSLNKVSSRAVSPNDTLYNLQYYLKKTAFSDVWQLQNHGVNKRGDTLVVAVVDSGQDTAHPDLLENRWINHNEIPFNGIDDDNNGYVDDVNGWNGAENNPRVFTAVSFDRHGTAIAGIIGAGGNNTTGICGSNWNIKVMPLICYPEKGGGDDLGVIRSMIYAYKMKKAYIESAGKKGACIVALNTSVGIDFAKPSDAPVWCAMYDSLGSVGILSSAATTNTETDVGQNGDIPSTCESLYTIVTSGTNSSDVRISSGYSAQFVDLAAPGDKIFSTTLIQFSGLKGPYDFSTGTSFAAPQVAGLTALMYQHTCDTFLNYAARVPDSAALLMASWIIQGVDKLQVLNGRCLSGGRLNAKNAIENMDNWCKAQNKSDTPAFRSETVIYPNPQRAGEEVSLQLADTSQNIRIQIYAATGMLCYEEFATRKNSVKLSTRNLRPGIYFVRIKNDNNTVLKQFILY